MIETGLNKILNEFQKCKIEKDNFIKEENELNEKFKEFSQNFDKFFQEFNDYIISIQNSKNINEEILKNIRKYQTNIIQQIEDFKNFKNTKIFELSNKFNTKINIDKISELINDILEVNIHIIENESLNFEKYNSKNYSNFYDSYSFNNNDNSNSLITDKENKILENYNNNFNINIIKEKLKCYGCNNEANNQCTNKECCNFLLCQNCIDIYSSNNEKINHKIIKIKGEEYKDKERKKEKYLDLLSEIYKSHFIKANYLFSNEIFPSFPDIKDNYWQRKYLDEIDLLFSKQNIIINNEKIKICKRVIKKYHFLFFILILKGFIKNINQ